MSIRLPKLLFGALLSIAWVTVAPGHAADPSTSIPLTASAWKANPKRVAVERWPASSAVEEKDGLLFSVAGPVAQSKAMSWERRWTDGGLQDCAFMILEYQARWLVRGRSRPPVLTLVSRGADGKSINLPLAENADLIDDGAWHRLIIWRALPEKPESLLLVLDSQDSQTWLRIRRLEFRPDFDGVGPAVDSTSGSPAGANFALMDLSSAFNDRYSALLHRQLRDRANNAQVQDAGEWFATSQVNIGGIPFQVAADPQLDNLIAPPAEPAENEEIVEHFGLHVPRGAVAPISWDGRTKVRVEAWASEIFLLLAAELPPHERNYFVGDGPNALEDVERFAVEVVYADGTHDLAFPYSVADGRHVIQRSLGAYVVPARGAVVREIILHHRARGARIELAGITVNKGEWLFRRLAEEPVVPGGPALPLDETITPYARRDGEILRLGNRHFEVTVDAAKGCALTALHHAASAAEIRVAPTPLVDTAWRNETLRSEDLKLAGISDQPNGFLVDLESTNPALPLRFAISISVGDAPELRLHLTVSNHGAQRVNARIEFPVVHDLQIGSASDLSCFFPQYRNVLTAENGTWYCYAGVGFPMQFFDVFNSVAGAGVSLTTLVRTPGERRYFLAKRDTGASFHVEYPELTTAVPGGGEISFPETALGIHAGDWHAAATRYREWLASWYRPVKSQDKPWFRESFWLLAEIADGIPPELYKLPVWLDPSGKPRLREILTEWERKSGRLPDILHLWDWAYTSASIQRWGDYGGKDFAALGGLEAFRSAIDDVQRNMHIPMSLYINGSLCSRDTDIFAQLGEKPAVVLNGKVFTPYPNAVRMCLADPDWVAHMQETYRRFVRETGARILYVDELGTREDTINRQRGQCFNPAHGHPIPLPVNATDYAFLQAVRDVVPGEVALYGENPCLDATAQYFDGVIHYYFNPRVSELFSPIFDSEVADGARGVPLNLYRFMFPKMMHLDLPLGTEYGTWQQLKFTFFNGEAIYDSFWNLDETRAHGFIVRAYDLKKQFKDCFASDTPEMLVPTERSGVLANRFPGRERTLWTIYNSRPTTFRGPVLSLPHTAGARYFDAWNERELKVEVQDSRDVVSLEIDPQSIGCVTQTLPAAQ